MTLVADADVPDPIIRALQELRYDIVRAGDLGLANRPDRDLMAAILQTGGVLLTLDKGIPSQAYLYEYAHHGLTVVVLRWKTQFPRDWQEMAYAILRDGHKWLQMAAEAPSIISVSRSGSRVRPWSSIPPSIADQARHSGAT